MTVRRVLAGSAATISIAVLDADGEPAAPGAGPFEVAVTDAAGDAVTGSPFSATVTSDRIAFELPAAVTATLDHYVCTAQTGGQDVATVTVETAGGFLYSIGRLREHEPTLADAARYSLARLLDERVAVEDRIEQICARPFVPRLRVETAPVRRGTVLLDRADVRTVRSVTVDGDEVDVDTVRVTGGRVLRLPGTCPPGTAVVHYEAGMDATPGPVSDAALHLAVDTAIKSAMPSRATAQQFGDQLFRVTVAGRDGHTGLPEVDSVLKDWSARTVFG